MEFGRRYAEQLGKALGGPVRLGRDERQDSPILEIEFEDGNQLSLSLHNRYLHYRENPGSLDTQVAYDVATANSTLAALRGESESARAEAIYPVIKNQVWGVPPNAGEQAEKPGSGHVRIELCGDLLLTFVLDSEHSMRYVGQETLDELGIADHEALFALARNNFAAYAQTQTAIETLDDGLYRARLDNVYDASLVLFLEPLLEQSGLPLAGGDVAFAVPARNALLMCAADDANAVNALRAQAMEMIEHSPHAISQRLYVHGRVRPLETSTHA
ncbi:hypothetical protein CK623_04510 [Vandammella animalimorsus]|uniref:DUF1444 family protein n=2 Tax=Vandammella animalimorsus TaxID=2029117 RepID=A0A2A2ASE0_9BURK|nr:hypothetical protein CK623_04510 [Vandammella animalimorsus]